MTPTQVYARRRKHEELFKRRVHSFVDSRTYGNDYLWVRFKRRLWTHSGVTRQLYNDIRLGVHDR